MSIKTIETDQQPANARTIQIVLGFCSEMSLTNLMSKRIFTQRIVFADCRSCVNRNISRWVCVLSAHPKCPIINFEMKIYELLCINTM